MCAANEVRRLRARRPLRKSLARAALVDTPRATAQLLEADLDLSGVGPAPEAGVLGTRDRAASAVPMLTFSEVR